MIGGLLKIKKRNHSIVCPLNSKLPSIKYIVIQDPSSWLYIKIPHLYSRKKTYHSMHLLPTACEMPQKQQSSSKLNLYSLLLTHHPRSPC